jgi:hypothetical protein
LKSLFQFSIIKNNIAESLYTHIQHTVVNKKTSRVLMLRDSYPPYIFLSRLVLGVLQTNRPQQLSHHRLYLIAPLMDDDITLISRPPESGKLSNAIFLHHKSPLTANLYCTVCFPKTQNHNTSVFTNQITL